MKDFIRGTQSRIGGAIMKRVEMGWEMKRGDQVEESNQSNLKPWQLFNDDWQVPEREARSVV
jgi:hypothetical protein